MERGVGWNGKSICYAMFSCSAYLKSLRQSAAIAELDLSFVSAGNMTKNLINGRLQAGQEIHGQNWRAVGQGGRGGGISHQLGTSNGMIDTGGFMTLNDQPISRLHIIA